MPKLEEGRACRTSGCRGVGEASALPCLPCARGRRAVSCRELRVGVCAECAALCVRCRSVDMWYVRVCKGALSVVCAMRCLITHQRHTTPIRLDTDDAPKVDAPGSLVPGVHRPANDERCVRERSRLTNHKRSITCSKSEAAREQRHGVCWYVNSDCHRTHPRQPHMTSSS